MALTRKDFLFIGPPRAGKSSLCAALLDPDQFDPAHVMKTQSVTFYKNCIIDLPGEFMTHPQKRLAFLAMATEVNAIVYVQAATDAVPYVPAGLLQVTPNLRLVGVVNKIDLPKASIPRAEQTLRRMGLSEPFFHTSIHDMNSIRLLRHWLITEGLFHVPA